MSDSSEANGQGPSYPTSFGRGWIPADRDIGLPDDDFADLRAQGWAPPPTFDHAQDELQESGSGAGGSPADAASDGSPHADASPQAEGPGGRNHNSWTPARKAAFLHHLAETGNVRASAKRVGLTHQSAYLAKRRDGTFKAAWLAALVLAREEAEQVLATRAIDGVEEAVWFRGERVGVKKRYDSRLLLAHLGRLDVAAQDEDAERHAARFDELLATVAGEGADERFLDHGETWADPDPLLPHAREPWADKAANRAYVEACAQWREDLKAKRATKADEPDACFTPWFEDALAEWDAWHARACATVDAAVAAESQEVFPDWVEVVDEAEEWGCEDERDEWGRVPDWNDPIYREDPPVEYKSWDMAVPACPPRTGEDRQASGHRQLRQLSPQDSYRRACPRASSPPASRAPWRGCSPASGPGGRGRGPTCAARR